jgi:hypothetical protein
MGRVKRIMESHSMTTFSDLIGCRFKSGRKLKSFLKTYLEAGGGHGRTWGNKNLVGHTGLKCPEYPDMQIYSTQLGAYELTLEMGE